MGFIILVKNELLNNYKTEFSVTERENKCKLTKLNDLFYSRCFYFVN